METRVSSSPSRPAQDAIEIWHAGVAAVQADRLVRDSVAVVDNELLIHEHAWDLSGFDRIVLIGGGKAAAAMAAGLSKVLGDVLPITGWINVPEGTEQSIPGVTVHAARPAAVNEPTAAAVIGTRRILELVAAAGPRDLCIAVITGGGSALLTAPRGGIELEDKLQVIRRLSDAGADITRLNTVRKHLSDVKGGRLLRACRGGHLITLILSDVLGDPIDLIASGPTVIDPSTVADAIAVLECFDPQRTLPQSVYRALASGDRHHRRDAELCDHTHIVLGNNAVAVDAAGIRAESLGYNHLMQSAGRCEGQAEEVGRGLADRLIERLRADPGEHPLNCLITGGEPTVRLIDAQRRGRGGRNQQLVLAAYDRLRQSELTDDQWRRIALLSGGTDGEDGPTSAAGAWIDFNVHMRAIELSLSTGESLRRNDAHTFFAACGGLLVSGPTGTNVCDLRVAVVKP